MEDLPIGSEIVLKVVESETEECNGCFFDNYGCNASDMFKCGYANRSDGKGIIFKEVKE